MSSDSNDNADDRFRFEDTGQPSPILCKSNNVPQNINQNQNNPLNNMPGQNLENNQQMLPNNSNPNLLNNNNVNDKYKNHVLDNFEDLSNVNGNNSNNQNQKNINQNNINEPISIFQNNNGGYPSFLDNESSNQNPEKEKINLPQPEKNQNINSEDQNIIERIGMSGNNFNLFTSDGNINNLNRIEDKNNNAINMPQKQNQNLDQNPFNILQNKENIDLDKNAFSMPQNNNLSMPQNNNFSMPQNNNLSMPQNNNFSMPQNNNLSMPPNNNLDQNALSMPQNNNLDPNALSMRQNNNFSMPQNNNLDPNALSMPQNKNFSIPQNNNFDQNALSMPQNNNFSMPQNNNLSMPPNNNFDQNALSMPQNKNLDPNALSMPQNKNFSMPQNNNFSMPQNNNFDQNAFKMPQQSKEQNNIIPDKSNPFSSNNLNMNNVNIQSNAVLNAMNNNQMNNNIISNLNINNEINNSLRNPSMNLMNNNQAGINIQMSNQIMNQPIDNFNKNNNNNQMGNISNNIPPFAMSNNPNFNPIPNQQNINPIPNQQNINPIPNQQNINQVPNPQQPFSFSRYKKFAKTGLKNMGDTSYLNSVLQLLGTNRDLARYFVNPKNEKFFVENIKSASLSFVIYRLFIHLYPWPEKEGREIYEPKTLLEVLGNINQVYKSKKKRNPNDLIFFIISFVHREINLHKVKHITNMDHTNKAEVIKTSFEDFKNSNHSIITNIFSWFELKMQKCSKCQKVFYHLNNHETYELDIASCFIANNGATLTIEKCLQFQSHKSQESFCEICQTYYPMDINIKIYSSPTYFVFSLNRQGNPAENLINIPFFLEYNINISQFLEEKKCFSKYELNAIVSFSYNENKYVCFGRSPVDAQWYLYNDEKVDIISIQNIMDLHNKNQFYVPCILLYKPTQ